MNRELITRVADQIEAHPENLFMDDWAASEIADAQGLGGECGTAACVAGWALIESGYTPLYSYDRTGKESSLTGEWVYRRWLQAWVGPDGTRYNSDHTSSLALEEMGLTSETELPYDDLDQDGYLFYWYSAEPETIVAALRGMLLKGES